MRISRLYFPATLESGRQVELDGDGAHYLRNVLRLKKDASIILFNGDGGEFSGIVVEASRKRVLIAVQRKINRSVESFLHVTSGMAISRGDRMDFALQKAVELGAYNITPLLTERCVVQLQGEKKQHKFRHWQRIIQHAAEQSGRTVLPKLNQPSELGNWLEDQSGLKVFLDPFAKTSLTQLAPVDNQVTILSGPEGGFSDREREQAKYAGFVPVRLGQRILRTETATLAALAAVQMLWGDFAQAGE